MNRVRGLGLACCLLLVACGGGGSSASSGSTLPGAFQLSATYDPWNSAVTLTWTHPTGSITSYNLEVSVNAGAFQRISASGIPTTATSAVVTFTAPPPELAILDFRMDAAYAGTEGPYSNSAEVKLPIAPPTYLGAAYVVSESGIDLTWTSTSKLADRFLLERAPCDGRGVASGPWTSLPLPTPLALTFVDRSGVESQGYLYRVTAFAGTIASPTTGPTAPVYLPPLAPTGFSSQGLPGAVSLSWVNQSHAATQIQVLRTTPGIVGRQVLATLPPTATTYQDPGLQLGYYSYSLVVSDGRNTAESPTLQAAPANPTWAPSLASTPLTADQYLSGSDLSPGGSWAFAAGTSSFTIQAAPWAVWPAWSYTGNAYLPHDFLRLDAQSHPHALYQISDATGESLNHVWWDGTAWNTETVQQIPPAGNLLVGVFRLDSTGTPRFLQDIGPGGSIQGLTYSSKVSGVWARESIDPTNITAFQGLPVLALDLSDVPHVLVPTLTGTREYVRNPDGTWTGLVLPNPPPTNTPYYFEDGTWTDAATAWVVYQVPASGDGTTDAFWALRKVSGAWQQPTLLRTFPHPGSATAAIARSLDGTRVAAVCQTLGGIYLYVWSPTGWQESLLPIQPGANPAPYLKIGFDGTDRLHILVKSATYTQDLVDLHE